MSKIVYRHHDIYVIERLLLEIGEHTLNKECEYRQLNAPKRLHLFFLEDSEYNTKLKYNYPMNGVQTIMDVSRYKLPQHGWIRTKLKV